MGRILAPWSEAHSSIHTDRDEQRSRRVVTLRTSPERTPDDGIAINRIGRKHHLQWVSEADTFNAYVDGDHEF
jgi:hypothetical protein